MEIENWRLAVLCHGSFCSRMIVWVFLYMIPSSKGHVTRTFEDREKFLVISSCNISCELHAQRNVENALKWLLFKAVWEILAKTVNDLLTLLLYYTSLCDRSYILNCSLRRGSFHSRSQVDRVLPAIEKNFKRQSEISILVLWFLIGRLDFQPKRGNFSFSMGEFPPETTLHSCRLHFQFMTIRIWRTSIWTLLPTSKKNLLFHGKSFRV